MRVLTVVGARPQFVKCAVVSRILRRSHEEILVHTGQHYDVQMSARLFEELEIPAPDHNLGVGSGPHGQMTGRMLEGLEPIVAAAKPDWVLVYGDTNSTLAGALVASKLHVPVAHVEAGLRSFNRRMPEEINRVVTDHLSTKLFCPTQHAVELLAQEGIVAGVHQVGDVMADSVFANLERARARLSLEELLLSLRFSPLPGGRFAFATLHRQENTDDPARLGAILSALSSLSVPVLLPLHPRTRRVLANDPTLSARVGPRLVLVDPIGYLELLAIAARAQVILTDSGGLQKEALLLGVRCVTLRDETEWVETIEAGANRLVGADPGQILAAAEEAIAAGPLGPGRGMAAFGDGHAAERIVERLERP